MNLFEKDVLTTGEVAKKAGDSFVTPDRGKADFAIHYTTVRSFAGCRN